MPDKNKIILGTNDDTYIAADDAGNIVLQHEGGNRISMNNTSITPASNEQIDLGSSTNKFKDLYLSSDSIFIGNTKLSSDPTTGELSTVVADAQGQFTAAPSAVGGDVDFSNLSNKQETLIAKWRGDMDLAPGNGVNNMPTFQFQNNAGQNDPSAIYGHPANTVMGNGGSIIPYPLLQTRVQYGSSYNSIPDCSRNAVLKLTNKENIPRFSPLNGTIPGGGFMYDDGIPAPSLGELHAFYLNPNFDHLKLVFYEEGTEGDPWFGGMATFNYYWRVLDANGNDVNLFDYTDPMDPNYNVTPGNGNRDFFDYNPVGNLRFGHPLDPTSWGFQDGNDTGTLSATTPTWELYQSTNEVEIEESIKINGDEFSQHGLILKAQNGTYRRLIIDTVGNVSSTLMQ